MLHAIAGEEARILGGKEGKIDRDAGGPVDRLVHDGAEMEGRRPVPAQVVHEVGLDDARVDDVLEQQDVLVPDGETAGEVDLEDLPGALGPPHVHELAGKRAAELAGQVRHEEGRALEQRHDDEGPLPQVPVDGAGDRLHAFRDLSRFVAPHEFHGPTSRFFFLVEIRPGESYTGRAPTENCAPRRSKRIRRPASKRKSAPPASRASSCSRSRPVIGGLPGRAKRAARRERARRCSSSEQPESSAASMTTASGVDLAAGRMRVSNSDLEQPPLDAEPARSRGPSPAASLRRPATA